MKEGALRTSTAIFAVAISVSLTASAAPKKKPSARRSAEPAKVDSAATKPAVESAGHVDKTLENSFDGTVALPAVPAVAAPQPTEAQRPALPEVDRVEEAPAAEASLPFSIAIDAGLAILSQAFRSNAQSRAGRLADYDYASQGVGAGATIRYQAALGSVFRLGVTGAYRYAGATGINAPYVTPDGRTDRVFLSLESHHAKVAATAGVHANVLGGVDAEAQVGPAIMFNRVDIDARAPLPSDRTIALYMGARVAAPAIASAGGRPIGFAIEGGHIGLLSDHAQNENLEDGGSATSRAFVGSAELGMGFFPRSAPTQLTAFAAYHVAMQSTAYAGSSIRNDATNGNASNADRSQETHVSSLGLRLSH